MSLSAPTFRLLLLKIKQAEQVASGERAPGYFDREQESPQDEEDEFEEVTVSSCSQRCFRFASPGILLLLLLLDDVTLAFSMPALHGRLTFIVAPTVQAEAAE